MRGREGKPTVRIYNINSVFAFRIALKSDLKLSRMNFCFSSVDSLHCLLSKECTQSAFSVLLLLAPPIRTGVRVINPLCDARRPACFLCVTTASADSCGDRRIFATHPRLLTLIFLLHYTRRYTPYTLYIVCPRCKSKDVEL